MPNKCSSRNMSVEIKSKKKTRKKVEVLSEQSIEDHFIREVRVQYQRSEARPFKIEEPEHIARFLRNVAIDNSREQVFALYLDGAHQVACYSIISIGGAASCSVHPREIFQRAILVGAISIAVAHNHPSGSLKPSEPDWLLTSRLHSAGALLTIPLLDHVIFSDKGQVSLRMDSRWPFSDIDIDSGQALS